MWAFISDFDSLVARPILDIFHFLYATKYWGQEYTGRKLYAKKCVNLGQKLSPHKIVLLPYKLRNRMREVFHSQNFPCAKENSPDEIYLEQMLKKDKNH